MIDMTEKIIEMEGLKIRYDKVLGLQIKTYDCDKCGNTFTKDELIIYNNEILCFACEEEAKNEVDNSFSV